MPQITVGDVKRAIAKESGAIPARTRGRFVTRKARSRTLVTQAAGVFCASVVLLTLVVPAQARPARCTDNEGSYRCDFKRTDSDGSFEVSARGRETYMLVMELPGVALGFLDVGRRNNIALPGRYIRSKTDRSCWINDSTSAKICVK